MVTIRDVQRENLGVFHVLVLLGTRNVPQVSWFLLFWISQLGFCSFKKPCEARSGSGNGRTFEEWPWQGKRRNGKTLRGHVKLSQPTGETQWKPNIFRTLSFEKPKLLGFRGSLLESQSRIFHPQSFWVCPPPHPFLFHKWTSLVILSSGRHARSSKRHQWTLAKEGVLSKA